MPYTKRSELPDNIQAIPSQAQDIYMAAFNAALKQYKDEGRSHATAWAAVKNKYEQRDGKWVAKESEAPVISDKVKRSKLKAALMSEYGIAEQSPIPKRIDVEEVFPDSLVYSVDGQMYKAKYTMGESGPIFEDPKKVIASSQYTVMESLRGTYADILQEAGKRNAIKDAARIKKILELCQELLSDESVPDEKAKEALAEATEALTWLKAQEAMKTEDGQQYPASAFAYVADEATPSGWKLRIWEDGTKKVTKKQLAAAAAALSPGGFRGQKVDIPTEALSGVKRKIRAAYRALDVAEDDIPRWVKETSSRVVIDNVLPLSEATVTSKGIARVVVIKPGLNASKERYYPPEMLKRDFSAFEGVKMYADHPTDDEDKARPERSIKDWVATLKNVHVGDGGQLLGEAVIVEPWLQAKLAALRDKGMLSEMGISINAIGTATKGEIEGVKTNVVEHIVRVRSVDFVTEPGAGGTVTMFESSNQDIDLINMDTLRERRPDLVKVIENEAKSTLLQEAKKNVEKDEQIKTLETSVDTLTKERDELKVKLEEAAKAQRIAEAKSVIDEAIGKAELPEAAKARLTESFRGRESADGIAEAVKAEAAYIAAITETGKVKGLGATTADTATATKALRESFKAMHPEWTDSQLDIAVSGR